MNVLAFDTCFQACSVAVDVARLGAKQTLWSEQALMDTGHAEALMPMIERVMKAAGLAFGDLQRIVVTEGPGTFTGVRTGVAAARGLALATGVPIVGVSSLWAIAAGAAAACRDDTAFDAVLAAVDARKGQYYVQAVDRDGAELTGPLLLEAEAAVVLCSERRLLAVGNGAQAIVDAGNRARREIALRPGVGDATLLHVPDMNILLNAASCRAPSVRLQPLYLRPPDAKPQTGKSLPWSST